MSIAKFTKVIKRDGTLQDFNIEAITDSIFQAASSVGGRDRELSLLIANEVVHLINRSIKEGDTPTTEEINDYIEKTLIERGHARTAKAFILERARKKTFDEYQKKAQFTGTIPYQPRGSHRQRGRQARSQGIRDVGTAASQAGQHCNKKRLPESPLWPR